MKKESLGSVKILERITYKTIEFIVEATDSHDVARNVFVGSLRDAKAICQAFISVGYDGTTEAIY